MSLLLGNGESNQLSIIKNPFTKDKVTRIMIVYRSSYGGSKWYATVEFENGFTEGKQSTPNVNTFEEVMLEIKKIENSLL